jgi:hypothetical protein
VSITCEVTLRDGATAGRARINPMEATLEGGGGRRVSALREVWRWRHTSPRPTGPSGGAPVDGIAVRQMVVQVGLGHLDDLVGIAVRTGTVAHGDEARPWLR